MSNELSVYRTRALPRGELRGRFIVAASVIDATRRALARAALDGIRDGGHEGIVLWAGREHADLTVILAAVVPEARRSRGRVDVDETSYARAAMAARMAGVVLLEQVHSHPGADARHSDGDDDMVIMPFEGMLSVVVPNFGIDLTEISGCGVHQFQRGCWTLCSPESVARGLTVVPSVIRLKGSDERDLF